MVLSLMICSTVFSVLALGFSIYSCIQLIAQQKSTHKIQYVGASPSDIDIEEELGKKTEEYNEKQREKVKEQFPFFNPEEEDLEETKGGFAL